MRNRRQGCKVHVKIYERAFWKYINKDSFNGYHIHIAPVLMASSHFEYPPILYASYCHARYRR